MSSSDRRAEQQRRVIEVERGERGKGEGRTQSRTRRRRKEAPVRRRAPRRARKPTRVRLPLSSSPHTRALGPCLLDDVDYPDRRSYFTSYVGPARARPLAAHYACSPSPFSCADTSNAQPSARLRHTSTYKHSIGVPSHSPQAKATVMAVHPSSIALGAALAQALGCIFRKGPRTAIGLHRIGEQVQF
jgi:hypothetical protein